MTMSSSVVGWVTLTRDIICRCWTWRLNFTSPWPSRIIYHLLVVLSLSILLKQLLTRLLTFRFRQSAKVHMADWNWINRDGLPSTAPLGRSLVSKITLSTLFSNFYNFSSVTISVRGGPNGFLAWEGWWNRHYWIWEHSWHNAKGKMV